VLLIGFDSMLLAPYGDSDRLQAMFAAAKKSPERLQVIERITEWTRERFKLPKEAVIFVSEIACPLPGCPPLETVVAFWIAERRYQFKLFKRVAGWSATTFPTPG
jgi:nitrate reductase delta subunit